MYTETMNDYIAKGYVRELSRARYITEDKLSTTLRGDQHQQTKKSSVFKREQCSIQQLHIQ